MKNISPVNSPVDKSALKRDAERGLEVLSPSLRRTLKASAVKWEKDGRVVVHPLNSEAFKRWKHIAMGMLGTGHAVDIYIGEETVQWDRF